MSSYSEFRPTPYAPLMIRLAVGFYFFILGLWGYLEPELSRMAIHKYSGFSTTISMTYVNFGCYAFFACGILLLLGLYTRFAAFSGVLLILPLLYGAGALSPEGSELAFFLERRSLMREIVVLAGCLSLILSGGGAFGLQGMIKGLLAKPS